MSTRSKTSKASGSDVGGAKAHIPQDVEPQDETIEPEPTNPGYSCQVCHGPDTKWMVRCDQCRLWSHYKCVGVDDSIANKPWSCSKCEPGTTTQNPSSSRQDSKPTSSGANGAKATSTPINPEVPETATIPTKDQLTPKQTGTKKKAPGAPKVNKKDKQDGGLNPKHKATGSKSVAKEVSKPEASKQKPTHPKAPSVSSRCSSRAAAALAKLKLQELEEKRELEKKEIELEKSYLTEKYKLMEEAISSSEASSDQSRSAENKVKDWLGSQRDENSKESKVIPGEHSEDDGDAEESSGESGSSDNEAEEQPPAPPGPQPPVPPVPQPPVPPGPQPPVPPGPQPPVPPDPQPPVPPAQEPYRQLTRSQLAARQAIPRDLAHFNGNVEDWPLFISAFNSTTEMCGFTNAENLYRLMKCIQPPARTAVSALLRHPNNIPRIIATLRMRYGQPDAIIMKLTDQISGLPIMKEGQLNQLVDFAVQVQNFCAMVDACELEEHMYNVELLRKLVEKLPPTIKLSWGQYRINMPRVNVATFSNWIYTLAEAANVVTVPISVEAKPERSSSKKTNAFVNAHYEKPSSEARATETDSPATNKRTNSNCIVCNGSCKSVDKCKRFLEFSRDSRWSTIKENKLCKCCLRRHDGYCQSKPCGVGGCLIKHHRLMHNPERNQPHSQGTAEPIDKASPCNSAATNTHSCHAHQTKSSESLLRYIPVVLQGKGDPIKTHAFLDNGSQLTLLDKELANELGLKGEVKALHLHWTGGEFRCEEDSMIIDLEISGDYPGAKRYDIRGARTVKENLLPLQTLNIQDLSKEYPYIKGLPIESYEDAQPRIIIGIKDQYLSLVHKNREGQPGQPVAVKTRLGWTVCGGMGGGDTSNLVHSVFHISACEPKTDENLHQAMKEYFKLDSIGIIRSTDPLVSVEEQRAQTLLQTLTVRTGNRYETGLLWRHDNTRLPDSKAMALRRFQCLEKRMQKDPALAETLNQKIADHLCKGYVRRLTEEELNMSFPRVWYLPVFPVTNPNKPGKVRIVWDAAAKSFGVSLNSALLKGPDQLTSLLTVLIKFREHLIGLTGDIREMFHQVAMRAEDQQSQRFYWRDEDGQLAVYAMCVMTFGACCSPSSAQYVKNTNADRFLESFPEAVYVIKEQHYVDDMLVSVETEEEAIQLAQQVKHVHNEGGFEIRNWISNSERVLESLREVNTQEKNLDLSPEMATEKVLGMWWCTAADIFTFKVGWDRYGRDLLEGRRRPTKREVLRVLMTIFDPLGLISPFLMYLKILLQEIWRAGTQWDEIINDEIFAKWQVWLKILPQVENVKIPRCYRVETPSNCADVQLHTFVDASANGIAACCYLRFFNNGKVESTLVAAKTRVSSLKYTSIPKLELQAALLGTRLAQTVLKSLSLKISKVFYWSDSRDVICWINSDHRRYSAFVAFRVSEILDTTEPEQWLWVPTKLNVADDGTKWEKFPDMTPDSRWYKAPEFLTRPEIEWPQQLKKGSKTDTELRPSMMAHFSRPDPLVDATRFSTWIRLMKHTSLLFRFPTYCRLTPQDRNISAKTLILQKAQNFLIRQAQHEVYGDEVAALTPNGSRKSITKSSPLFKYTPWLDNDGLLRMRGRIDACAYAASDAKNPIILPPTHHTTQLIMHHYHNKYNHKNHATTINELRQSYCIPRFRREFAKLRNNCQRCKNERAIPQPPMMAQLPPARLDAYTAPFTHVGIDYFGPMEVAVGRRVEKRWGMLITCLTTRAIHLEVVHSLSTNSCIMGISNFRSRRGTPRTIYSDHGTCFIGASRELKKNEAALNMDDVMKEFVSADTTWKFITPASPHMGGSWERMVGIVKKNLMALCPSPRPNDEVLRNMLTEIENTVNSRPLTDLIIDDESAPALTPNHFLLLSSNGSKPLAPLNVNGSYLGQSYKTSQKLADHFWKRWLNEYLPDITRRTKWYANTKPIAIGDVVVIVDAKLPRNCWPRGKVIGVIPGRDGLIRSATVKTSTGGIYERAVANLAVLDVRCDG